LTLKRIEVTTQDKDRKPEEYRDRGNGLLERLRLEHLNSEEKDTLENTCLELRHFLFTQRKADLH
jgi:hypothetical protein